METKPFQIQAPEDIAKEYGGDKQKIAQAMQMGVIDPTAGVLAGMFIDRIRSAQMQEMAPQPTVAQQVMGGASLAPVAQPPMAPQAGLGALPAPGMEAMMPPAPQAPPEGAPMGMAGGGLADLPVPDGMFDEPENGGYGGGGLVAFADGGPLGPWFEEQAVGAVPGIGVAGRARTPERNREVGGVSGSFHIGDNARDFTPPKGMSLTELGDRLKRLYGPGYDVIYNSKGHYDHVHVEPGPELGRRVRGGRGAPAGWERLPAESSGAASTQGAQPSWSGGESLEKSFPGLVEKGLGFFDQYMPAPKREAREMLLQEARAELSPERQKKMRDEDKWSTLAEIGFNMAASNSPYFLQAVGAAAAAALPGARAAKKERDAARREALRNYAELEGLDNKEARERVSFALDYAKSLTGLKKDDIGRFFEQRQTEAQEKAATERTSMQVAGGISQANISAGSYVNTADKQVRAALIAANAQARKEAVDLAQKDPRWMEATAKKDSATAAAIVEEYYNRSRASLGGGLSDLGGATAGTAGGAAGTGRIVSAVPIPQ